MIDASTIALLVGVISVCGSLIYVGRKIESVDRSLASLKEDLDEIKGSRVVERVAVLEHGHADTRAAIADLKERRA